MQAKLNRLGDDVCAAQRKAEINVVDANVESQLRSLLPAQIESQEAVMRDNNANGHVSNLVAYGARDALSQRTQHPTDSAHLAVPGAVYEH